MELVYQGKTKDVYRLDDHKYLLQFKDTLTGSAGVFDPGANAVGLELSGAGLAGLRLTQYFFQRLAAAGIPTHYLDASLADNTMTVKPATMFGHGVEVICRFRAVGSFVRRYGLYAKEGQELDGFVEFTLKDDLRDDPPITRDGLVMLGILTNQEYDLIKNLTKKIASFIRDELKAKDMELYDLKLEFGRVGANQEVALIDEISGGNMRVYQGGKSLDPLALTEKFFEA